MILCFVFHQLEIELQISTTKSEYPKKERFGAFSTMPLYEVVHELIRENEKLKARISDLEEERKREEERAVREDVYLGEDLKEKITEVQNELGINTRELIDFFLVSSTNQHPNACIYTLYRKTEKTREKRRSKYIKNAPF